MKKKAELEKISNALKIQQDKVSKKLSEFNFKAKLKKSKKLIGSCYQEVDKHQPELKCCLFITDINKKTGHLLVFEVCYNNKNKNYFYCHYNEIPITTLEGKGLGEYKKSTSQEYEKIYREVKKRIENTDFNINKYRKISDVRQDAIKKKLEDVTQKKVAPKKLSKAGEWMRDNHGGIATVTDWRAVNK